MCQSNLFLISPLHLRLSQLTFLADCRYSSAPLSCPALLCFIQSSDSWGKSPSASSVFGNSSPQQGLWMKKGTFSLPKLCFICVCMLWSSWLCGRWALISGGWEEMEHSHLEESLAQACWLNLPMHSFSHDHQNLSLGLYLWEVFLGAFSVISAPPPHPLLTFIRRLFS